MEGLVLIKILFLVGISAIFSGLEAAFLSADKLILELDKEKTKNIIQIKALTFLLNKPSHILSTLLILVTVSMVLFSSVAADMFHAILIPLMPHGLQNDIFILILETLFITIITLIFAEFIPKSIILLSPNKFLFFCAIPLTLIVLILYPVVTVVILLSKFLLSMIFRQRFTENKFKFQLQDIHSFLKNSIDVENKTPTVLRAKMASNVIDFKKIRIRDCMVPRIKMVSVNKNLDFDKVKEVFVKNEHSRILVYKDKIDEIIGYYHFKDLLKSHDKTLNIHPITIVPETSYASDLLVKFIDNNQNIAIVVDEFGGTAGIATLEDIIEEIFGEIKDEHDIEEEITKKLSGNTFLISASTKIDDLNEKYDWNITEGEYETLAGYIIYSLGRIPKKNETIKLGVLKFLIVEKGVADIKMVKVICDN